MPLSSSPREVGVWLRALSLGVWLCTAVPFAAAAQSRPQTFSLNWVRGEGAERCASSQLLARAIEQLLGPVLRTPSEAEVAIEGTVTELKPGWFEMKTRVLTPEGDVLGARTLQREADDCASLTPAILLVLTLTLDPEAAAHGFPTVLLARLATSADPASALLAELEREEKAKRAATSEPPGDQRPPARKSMPVSKPKVATEPSAQPRAKPAQWGAFFQLGLAGQLFVLPHAWLGVGLLTGLTTPSPLSLTLSVHYWAPAAARFESFGDQKEVLFSAVQSELSFCFPISLALKLQLSPCFGWALGMRWVDASVLQRHPDVHRLYGGPSGQASLRYALSERWYASLDLAGAFLFPQDRFTFRNFADHERTIFEPKPYAAWSTLALGVRL
jgi:hypothetical protein